MALHVKGANFGKAWNTLLCHLMGDGEESSPRGMKTRELLNVTLEVTNGLNNILFNPIRDPNYRFMIAEWLWIQAGLNDVDILAKYNSVMRNFSDDGEILSGAYGPRLMPQIPYVLASLAKPDSRQAVATIWTPSPSDSKDIPCTISLQWMVRFGFLHCTATMRSSDIWLGLPYDFFTFSQLTNYVAMKLGRPVGSVTMNLASSHIYEQHFESAKTVINTAVDGRDYVSSPHIPRFVQVPSSEWISRLLREPPKPHEVGTTFWAKYFMALSQNKTHALEVLRELEAYKA